MRAYTSPDTTHQYLEGHVRPTADDCVGSCALAELVDTLGPDVRGIIKCPQTGCFGREQVGGQTPAHVAQEEQNLLLAA